MKIYISYSMYDRIAQLANPDDPWDADDIEHYLESMHASTDSNAELGHYNISFDVAEYNRNVYAVVVHYSTGDSFHREDGLIEIPAVFANEWEADQVALAIRDNANGAESSSIIVNDVEYYCGTWSGYFEHVTYVDVIELTVNRNNYV